MYKIMKQALVCLGVLSLLNCAGDIKGAQGDSLGNGRPSFFTATLNSTVVTVSGSVDRPSKVIIKGKSYSNISDTTCNLGSTGRGHLDSGAIDADTIYYLYAIPATSGESFDLVASVNPPTSGPTNFKTWSYLGAFLSSSSSTIVPFHASGGFVSLGEPISAGNTHLTDYDEITLSPYPVTVRKHWGSLDIRLGAAQDLAYASGSGLVNSEDLVVRTQANSIQTWVFGFVPAFQTNKIWIHVDNPVSLATWFVYGWQEDLAEWP